MSKKLGARSSISGGGGSLTESMRNVLHRRLDSFKQLNSSTVDEIVHHLRSTYPNYHPPQAPGPHSLRPPNPSLPLPPTQFEEATPVSAAAAIALRRRRTPRRRWMRTENLPEEAEEEC
ncbi:hypothetical protein TorRG33x02_200960 [Trema orientale]|uniref:Uncharacterized protein n=1 Tax=Trema orientale TaxID=63057 RepID=A0A2P5EEZ2_TREOI|nr:hypothetical protein TorRG33x02_200960 [Trema orientale]